MISTAQFVEYFTLQSHLGFQQMQEVVIIRKKSALRVLASKLGSSHKYPFKKPKSSRLFVFLQQNLVNSQKQQTFDNRLKKQTVFYGQQVSANWIISKKYDWLMNPGSLKIVLFQRFSLILVVLYFDVRSQVLMLIFHLSFQFFITSFLFYLEVRQLQQIFRRNSYGNLNLSYSLLLQIISYKNPWELQQMYHDPKDDATASIIASLNSLQSTKFQQEEEISKLRKIIDELVGYEIKSKMCPKNHPLRYVESSKSLLSHHWCDKCKKKCDKVSAVRWTCPQCNYDACAECEGYLRTMCPYIHVLAEKHLKEGEKSNKGCDICLKPIMGTFFSCGCNFDMCNQCKRK